MTTFLPIINIRKYWIVILILLFHQLLWESEKVYAINIGISIHSNGPDKMFVNVISTDIICNDIKSGSAELTVFGGIAPYSFKWSNGNTNKAISNLENGTYIATVTDAEGYNVVKKITISILPDKKITTSVSDNIKPDSHFLAYPNPASDNTTISFTIMKSSKVEVKLYDAMGKQIDKLFDGNILENTKTNINVSVTKYNPGIYFCTIENENTKITNKLMVLR